jgi:hypothetical protein
MPAAAGVAASSVWSAPRGVRHCSQRLLPPASGVATTGGQHLLPPASDVAQAASDVAATAASGVPRIGWQSCCHRGVRPPLLPPTCTVAASDVRRCCHRQATLLPAVSGGVRRCYHPCVALLQGDFGAARCSEPVRASPERRRSNEPRGLGEWASCRGADDGDRYSKGKAGISATNGGRWSC